MQIANGFVTTCPEISHYVCGLTPAEAVILSTMHKAYSNGTPLKGLVIMGEATEIDQYGKPLQIAERKPFKRTKATVEPDGSTALIQVADFETVYTPSTKPRSQIEEVNRLRRKYVGNVTVNGKTISAWEAAFGNGSMIRMPETFKEVEHIIGPVFTDNTPVKVSSPTATIGESAPQVAVEALLPEPAKNKGGRPRIHPIQETANV